MAYIFRTKENDKRLRLSLICLLVLYSLSIICFTIMIRVQSFEGVKLSIFWSYSEWIAGDTDIGRQILGNIILFIPVGYLASSCIGKNAHIVFWGIALSIFIEVCQYFSMRGLFEIDDIINNSMGAIIGIAAHKGITLVFNRKYADIFAVFLGAGAILCTTVLCICMKQERIDSSSRNYCIQIDSVDLNNDQLRISGFALWFDHTVYEMKIALKSTDNLEQIPLTVEYGLERSDVQDYFRCDYDYTNSGFNAIGHINKGQEYEIVVSLDWPRYIPTGIYYSENSIHYLPKSQNDLPFADGKEINEIICNGELRDYCQDYQCWIYQYNGCLYWIFDNNSPFFENEDACIQYQLWTTQVEKLPSYRLENGWDWDERNGQFEEYEVLNISQQYRVMRRLIPTDYAVKSILTGYYMDDKWVWKTYFRPIYYFNKQIP